MKKALPWAILLVLFNSFEAGAQQANPSSECIRALGDKAELVPLKEKVAIGLLREQPDKLLTNTDRASKEEAELISRWVAMRGDCNKLNDPIRQTMSPAMRRIDEAVYPALQSMAVQLIEGKITYGEFARQRKLASERINTEMEKARQTAQ